MSETARTPVKSEQDDNGLATKSSGPSKASYKTPSNSASKKNGVNLTPVESLLFFNIVRFNKDPSSSKFQAYSHTYRPQKRFFHFGH